ncbi:MAG: glycine--tRNA ligase [SAR324 cluster bacterium]|nr:glycine--tRNA ligase [SAR324 cluster bacterium]MCZ6646343.1 glycine--tRNA ligase [SAR324 cluster bacterium]
MPVTMEQLVSLAKRRGFVYAGSEIYGGLANSWDYGPLGVELKNNIKNAWWKHFVQDRLDVVGLDSAILMNPQVWEASGHVGGFSDPLVDCRNCKTRHRADKLIETYLAKHGKEPSAAAALEEADMEAFLEQKEIKCPHCGVADFTPIRQFNLMFKTFMGVTEDSSSTVYLRPETAQGIFVNFKNVQTTSRKKVPFGIGQIGKSFRNEITPGNFIFRTREFEQMELEFFCHPSQSSEWFTHWKNFCMEWLLSFGMTQDNLRMRDHAAEELSHYSQATADIEYCFPFGWGELWGVAHRGDFDLTQHQEHSKKELAYVDPVSGEKYLPHVIEPALGVDRLALAFLADAYREEEVGGEQRVVLGFHPQIAPLKAAVLPLSKKLNEPAEKLVNDLRRHLLCDYDEAGSIGRRYRRQDEAGTPFCVTLDFESLEDQAVTVRERDAMTQERIPMDKLAAYLNERLEVAV